MGSTDYDHLTREQLIGRINELQALSKELIQLREQEDALNFPWAGNLGHWFWNIPENHVTFNPLKITNLGYKIEEIPKQVSYQFFTSRLHPEDYQKAMETMTAHLSGELPAYEMEYRIRAKDGSYKWYYDRGKITQFDQDGKPLLLSGIVFDITAKKEEEKSVQLREEEDPLTQLYTLERAVRQVKAVLSEQEPGMVNGALVLDVDHLRKINTSKGELFGDTILQQIGDLLRRNAGENGIAARIGGDEFLLFQTNVTAAGFRKTAEQLQQGISRIYIDGSKHHLLTASAGFTVTDSKDCGKIINEAFLAMLHAQQFYSGILSQREELSEELDGQPDPAVSLSKIRKEDNWEKENILSFAFHSMEQVSDLKNGLHVLFSRISRTYGIDAVCISQTGEEPDQPSSALYYWTAEDAFLPVHDKIVITGKLAELRENWVHKREPLLLRQERIRQMEPHFQKFFHTGRLLSLLLCPVYVQGKYTGCIAYGSSHSDMVWSTQTIRELAELSNIQYAVICKVSAESSSRAKTEFLSRMSHEIRTPLNSIIGMIEIVKNNMDDPGRVAYSLTKIDGAAHYLLSLISNVLEMSKIESGELSLNEEAFSIQKAIHSVEELVRGVLAKKQKLICTVCCVHDHVWGDCVSLEQVLINLTVNAVKFTSENGEIHLTVEELPCPDGSKPHYRFSVQDNGIGIAKEDIERIFQRFEQLERAIPNQFGGTGLGGAGLGLCISEKLVAMMGGKIEVESAPGKGSCFSFVTSFPEAELPECPAELAAGEQGQELAGYRILVVEDNEWNIEVARDLLEMHGAEVLLARNGKEGLETFSASKEGEISAILMDIRMPVMDGIESACCIRELERSDRDVPIIALTSNAFDQDSEKSMESGMDAHLSKPVDVNRLIHTILRVSR